jgi:hypothetical protein
MLESIAAFPGNKLEFANPLRGGNDSHAMKWYDKINKALIFAVV